MMCAAAGIPTDLNIVYNDKHGCQPIELEN
jgi:hypothetical protein